MKLDEIKKSLPEAVTRAISGYTWRQNNIGLSPARVFRLDAANRKSLYLKISPRTLAHSLLQEKIKLEWLDKRLPAPEVLLFHVDENADYLLLSAISGTDASDDSLKDDIPRLIEQLTVGLKTIHALPIENCPFDERNASKIELIEKLVESNSVDEDDFDDIHLGKTAAELFRKVLDAPSFDEDLVFTHGDYCVPNVILDNRRLNGFVDWGNAGIADRFQDLALLSRSIIANFGKAYEKTVFEAYGIAPDWEKIHFYRLLDEFF
jgi:kanamycin kinase/aminoglycoside 3'-phosphotransferase-2